MQVITHAVAPLIHYAPFYSALVKLADELDLELLFPRNETDAEVILKASAADAASQDSIVLALTSIPDLERDPTYVIRVRQSLAHLVTLIPRIPIWYVCARQRENEVREKIVKALAGSSNGQRLKIVCYPRGTTTNWVVSNSFPDGTYDFVYPRLSFEEDCAADELERGVCDFAVTLHPWRYAHSGRDVSVFLGPPVAPFAFTATLFHQSAFGRPELEKLLLRVRKEVFTEIVRIYLAFETPGFDWRARRKANPDPLRDEYLKALLSAFSTVAEKTSDGHNLQWVPSQTELVEGLRCLAESKIWMLPEAELEQTTDGTSLRSLRGELEERATHHSELEQHQKDRRKTQDIVLSLAPHIHRFDELVELYRPHSWDDGQERLQSITESLKTWVFKSTSHGPLNHRDGSALRTAMTDRGLHQQRTEACKVLNGVHGFATVVTDAMFHSWDGGFVDKKIGLKPEVSQPPVASICLAYSLYLENLPACWVRDILVPHFTERPFPKLPGPDDDYGLYLLHVAIPIPLMRALLALDTMARVLENLQGEFAVNNGETSLLITGDIHADGRGTAGIKELAKRFAEILKNKDAFAIAPGRLQNTTRAFHVISYVAQSWKFQASDDSIACAVEFRLSPIAKELSLWNQT